MLYDRSLSEMDKRRAVATRAAQDTSPIYTNPKTYVKPMEQLLQESHEAAKYVAGNQQQANNALRQFALGKNNEIASNKRIADMMAEEEASRTPPVQPASAAGAPQPNPQSGILNSGDALEQQSSSDALGLYKKLHAPQPQQPLSYEQHQQLPGANHVPALKSALATMANPPQASSQPLSPLNPSGPSTLDSPDPLGLAGQSSPLRKPHILGPRQSKYFPGGR